MVSFLLQHREVWQQTGTQVNAMFWCVMFRGTPSSCYSSLFKVNTRPDQKTRPDLIQDCQTRDSFLSCFLSIFLSLSFHLPCRNDVSSGAAVGQRAHSGQRWRLSWGVVWQRWERCCAVAWPQAVSAQRAQEDQEGRYLMRETALLYKADAECTCAALSCGWIWGPWLPSVGVFRNSIVLNKAQGQDAMSEIDT